MQRQAENVPAEELNELALPRCCARSRGPAAGLAVWATGAGHRRTPEPGHRRSALAGFGVSEQLVGRRELLVARGAHEAAGLHGAGSFGKRSHTRNARAVGEASRRDQCFFGRSCCVYSCANRTPHGQASPLSDTPVPSPVSSPVPSWYCDLPRGLTTCDEVTSSLCSDPHRTRRPVTKTLLTCEIRKENVNVPRDLT